MKHMVRLEPSLQNLKVFGTEGEVNVCRSMQTSFSNAEYLFCFLHTEDNIVKKCASLGIEPKICISEIFGGNIISGDCRSSFRLLAVFS